MLIDLVTSPIWPRVFLGALLLVGAVRIRRFVPRQYHRLLVVIPLVLLVRDLTSGVVSDRLLFLVSDLAIIMLYFAWVHPHRPMLGPMIFVGTVSVLGSAAVVDAGIRGRHSNVPILADIVTRVTAVSTIAGALLSVREVFAPHAGAIVRSRWFLIPGLAIAMLVGFAPSGPPAWMLTFLVPLSYFSHIAVLRVYESLREWSLGQQLAERDRSIETLFDFMRETRQAMLDQSPIDKILSYVVGAVTESVRASAGVAFMADDSGVLRVRAVHGSFPPPYRVPESARRHIGGVDAYFRNRGIPLGETVLGQVAKRNEAVFYKRCEDEGYVTKQQRGAIEYAGSLIAVPITYEERGVGVPAVAHRDPSAMFTDEDFAHASDLTQYASVTIESLFHHLDLLEKRKLETEVNMAADVQKGLLPTNVPHVRGLTIGRHSSAAHGMSGDYWDVFEMPATGRVCATICDVSGKGVPASLIMVMVRTVLRILSTSKSDVATMMSWVNRGASGSIQLGRFATMALVTYNPLTRELEYTNAGHIPLLRYNRTHGEITHLHGHGIPIGIEQKPRYETQRHKLEAADVVVMVTDGIVEARNRERTEFGWERLEALIAENGAVQPQELVNRIVTAVRTFVGSNEQFDDETILVLPAD